MPELHPNGIAADEVSLEKRPLIQLIFYNNPDNYPPIINSVRLLSHAGFEVDIFCRDNGENWDVAYPTSVHLHRLQGNGSSSWRDYGRFLACVMRLANRRAGVFVGHDMHGLLPARLLAWLYRRPLIYHCHDYTDATRVLTRGMRLARDFEQRFARTANLVIVPDADRAQIMRRGLRLQRSPLIVANAPLKQPLIRSTKLVQALALQNKNFERIVFRQGRIGDGHAIEATLRSITYWQSQKWGFVVIGPGEISYQEHLLAIAKKLGVQQQFVILPPVGYDEVAQWTAGADVGHALYQPLHINNIHISTASNKIMEYMSSGLPLLVSDRPALRSLVEQNSCGIAADEANPQSIAAAVNQLFGNSQHLQQMGIASRQAFENVFCYDRQFVPVVEAVYKLIAGRHK